MPYKKNTRRVAGRSTAEVDFQREVIKYAVERGWLYHFCTDARKCQGNRGLPDVIFVRRGEIIFIEFKSDEGELSKFQEHWKRHIPEDCYYLAKREDWKVLQLIFD